MCSLPNMTKSDLSEPLQSRKRKLEKTNVKIDEWATLEWICVESPTRIAGE